MTTTTKLPTCCDAAGTTPPSQKAFLQSSEKITELLSSFSLWTFKIHKVACLGLCMLLLGFEDVVGYFTFGGRMENYLFFLSKTRLYIIIEVQRLDPFKRVLQASTYYKTNFEVATEIHRNMVIKIIKKQILWLFSGSSLKTLSQCFPKYLSKKYILYAKVIIGLTTPQPSSIITNTQQITSFALLI